MIKRIRATKKAASRKAMKQPRMPLGMQHVFETTVEHLKRENAALKAQMISDRASFIKGEDHKAWREKELADSKAMTESLRARLDRLVEVNKDLNRQIDVAATAGVALRRHDDLASQISALQVRVSALEVRT